MAMRKRRTRVVIDTNVFVRNFKSRNKHSANRRVVRLWLLERRLQLVVSEEVVDEYVEIFSGVLGMDDDTVVGWRIRFTEDSRSTVVNLGRHYKESRDPDDNVMLSTAHAGKAQFLLTNDRDLLDLPQEIKKKLPFEIVSPAAFVDRFE